jgi:hypothetical protein
MAAQKLRVLSFGISLDGYSAGPNQSLDHPLGVGGTGLMEWFFPTRTLRGEGRGGNAAHAPGVVPFFRLYPLSRRRVDGIGDRRI